MVVETLVFYWSSRGWLGKWVERSRPSGQGGEGGALSLLSWAEATCSSPCEF